MITISNEQVLDLMVAVEHAIFRPMPDCLKPPNAACRGLLVVAVRPHLPGLDVAAALQLQPYTSAPDHTKCRLPLRPYRCRG